MTLDRIYQLAEDLRKEVFLRLDDEPEFDANDAGSIAQDVKTEFINRVCWRMRDHLSVGEE